MLCQQNLQVILQQLLASETDRPWQGGCWEEGALQPGFRQADPPAGSLCTTHWLPGSTSSLQGMSWSLPPSLLSHL